MIYDFFSSDKYEIINHHSSITYSFLLPQNPQSEILNPKFFFIPALLLRVTQARISACGQPV